MFFSLESYYIFFFFQAEDGIRDIGVTGVQTCALPIFLSLLLKNQGLALHRDMIRKEVWGADFQGASNIVETYIKQIRKKLQDKEYHWIKTIRGYGDRKSVV